MNLLNEIDLAYCDTCGNYVPTVDEDGELLCAYEYAEYPDIATVVGQRVSGCWYSKTKNRKQKVEKMKLIATYPSYRKPLPETYIVDSDEAEYWVEQLIAAGALTVQVRDQSACRFDIPLEIGGPPLWITLKSVDNYFRRLRRVDLLFGEQCEII